MKITKTAWLAFILAFIFAFMIGAKVQAQDAAQKYGVTFPVEELGNCADINECKAYCDDPVNQTQCVYFAKKKGFYKEKRNAVQNSIAIAAQQELGCESQSACKQFCSLEENKQKCREFAKKYKLEGEKSQEIAKQDTLGKAKEILGCESVETCKVFCQKEENRQKCEEFAKTAGLKGGVKQKGPGGCTTKETCSTYCSDPNNFEECSKFAPQNKEGFKGPGGCNSPESCKAFCGENPQKCRIIKSGTEVKSPQGLPAFTNADDKARFCREYPEKCNTATSSGGTFNRQEFCKQYPEKCAQLSPRPVATDYAKKCVDSGCTWNGTSCSCANKSPYPAQSYSPKPTYTTQSPLPSPEEYCKSKGCTWTNNSCQCTNSTYTAPQPSPTTQPTPLPEVRGTSAVRGLLDRVLDIFR